MGTLILVRIFGILVGLTTSGIVVWYVCLAEQLSEGKKWIIGALGVFCSLVFAAIIAEHVHKLIKNRSK